MRLFVGVRAGDDVRTAVAAVRASIDASLQRLQQAPPRVLWTVPQGLHLTLRFLGEVPDARVAAIANAIAEPFAEPPFAVRWHGLGAFPSVRRPRAIWLGVGDGAAGLARLEHEVARRIGGLAPGEASAPAAAFHPHLTLARVKVDAPGVHWPGILESAPRVEASSPIDRVVLFRSRGLPGGAGYEELAQGPLRG